MSGGYKVVLSPEEFRKISLLAMDPKLSKTMRRRCEIILALHRTRNEPYLPMLQEAARLSGVSENTVELVKGLYRDGGMAAVLHYNRNPIQDTAMKKVDSRTEELLSGFLASPPPAGKKRWTIPLLMEALNDEGISLSRNTVSRALKNLGLSTRKPAYP